MLKQKILVVEDEEAIAELLVYALEREGFSVMRASTGNEAESMGRSGRPDLILLDLMLPDGSGFELCKIAAKEDWNIPIIMLTAKSDMVDKILGMELGADDYITKPFDVREVIVRIKAIFRRIGLVIKQSQGNAAERLAIGGQIEIARRQRKAWKNDEETDLKNKEFDLLLFLADNRGIVFTRPQLLDQVWGFDFAGDTRTVDIHVQRLRKKLDDGDGNSVIETVFGVGYRMP
ncbi:response regulator transcription factor [Paenibacillus sepulcri]|uniref:Response regulator transcription factor n=1 Tax=Paenibacillus sepulcri TaxID=359917 RepID=A0ABS7C2R9_9BACL|nr:response regulator transcription factor [Paenibacillus sepulcri]